MYTHSMKTITLTADSGSTKTDWLLQQGNERLARITTQGINPFMLSKTEIETILQNELLSNASFVSPTEVCFYGAGCRGEQCQVVEAALRHVMPQLTSVVVGSDLLGAAKALFGNADGVACILGTGSNSGLFLGGELVQNVSPLGYVLGDEGSGAVLGKRLLGDVLKQQLPAELCQAFADTYQLTGDDIIQRVYKQPFANRFLASFAPFLAKHRNHAAIQTLLVDEFSRFFQRNVATYARPDLSVAFVGSIAYYFQHELQLAAQATGFKLGRIMKCPLA